MNHAQTSSNKMDEMLAQLISMGFNATKAEKALEANEWDMDATLGYLLSDHAGELEVKHHPQPPKVSPQYHLKGDRDEESSFHDCYPKQEEGDEESSLPTSPPQLSKVSHDYYPKQDEDGDEESSLPTSPPQPSKVSHDYYPNQEEDGDEESSLPTSPPHRPSPQFQPGIQQHIPWSTQREERHPYNQQDCEFPKKSKTKAIYTPEDDLSSEASQASLDEQGSPNAARNHEPSHAPGAYAVSDAGSFPDDRPIGEEEEPPLLSAYAVNDDQGTIVRAVPLSARRKYVIIPLCFCFVVLVPVVYTIVKYVGNSDDGTPVAKTTPQCVRIDCEVSSWESWSPCSETCDGFRNRTRDVVTNADCQGDSCPHLFEEEDCNVNCCVDCEVTKWSDWSTCSVTCGGGIRTRNRTVTITNDDCGQPCPPLQETHECNTQDCCIDCEVSDWSDWGPCSADCGGTRTRTRTVEQSPDSCGTPCPSLQESQDCNDQPCDAGGNSPTNDPPPTEGDCTAEECCSDSDCATLPEALIDHVCNSDFKCECPYECCHHNDCGYFTGGDKFCSYNRGCAYGKCVHCDYDSVCGSGVKCNCATGECETETEECECPNSDSDCDGTDTCVDCKCIPVCEIYDCCTNSDCPGDYYCRPPGDCVCSFECCKDNDCKSGEKCKNNRCEQDCECPNSDSDCSGTDTCVDCKCIPVCKTYDCCKDSDCPKDYYCRPPGDCVLKETGQVQPPKDKDPPPPKEKETKRAAPPRILSCASRARIRGVRRSEPM